MTSGEAEPGAGAEAPEERARADLYGLISRLFFAPADPNLLAEISRSNAGEEESEGGALPDSWRALREACRGAFPAVVRQEFDDLFIGVGRAAVTPYVSAYAGGAPDRYVVALRDRLAAWGLARRSTAFEVEDHVAGLSDTMRWLIHAGRGLEEQKRFFDEFVQPGAQRFCVAVQHSPNASFYKYVAAFALAFFELEQEAFAMIEAGEG